MKKKKETPFPDGVIWQLIDSGMGLFLRHHLPSPVEVAVSDDDDLKKKMPFY